MAQALVTQVGRDGQAAQAPAKKPSLFRRLFCCCCGKAEAPAAADGGAAQQWLLPPLLPEDEGKKCLVLDLDETLVHSSFKPVANADFIIPVEIEEHVYQVYVLKRPGVDDFLKRVGEMFEVVVFTASLAKYADPVIDLLDKHGVVRHRLFREACSNHKGNYVKDLARVGRPLKDTIIIDNSAASYAFQPENAVPIESWFDDQNDTALLDLLQLLEELTRVSNVRTVLEKIL